MNLNQPVTVWLANTSGSHSLSSSRISSNGNSCVGVQSGMASAVSRGVPVKSRATKTCPWETSS